MLAAALCLATQTFAKDYDLEIIWFSNDARVFKQLESGDKINLDGVENVATGYR